MCAINGFNFKDEGLIAGMNTATRHRGPDGTGVFCGADISLGHNRLSIIDLSDAGKQPMASGDGRHIIVFNGEIYNYRELKKELAGYDFKSASDTEVILAAYARWGEECVKKFNGIFAFAIWDKEKRGLFLARDPLGVKPLYYFWDGKRFIFSSEIKAILEHDVPRVLDREAFNHYLRLLYVPAPLTMFRDIKKMPPASTALLAKNELRISRYDFEAGDKKMVGDFDAAKEAARQTIGAAVERQLVSDRPLGVYLSGGIDSSVVLDCAKRARGNLDTFSVGFDLPDVYDREKFNQDFDLARRTAKFYGTKHNEVMMSADEALAALQRSVWHLDEPIANPTALPMMHLAGFAKQKADVVLGGDGGDELFGGYERYRLSLISSYYQKFAPEIMRKFLGGYERFGKLNTPADSRRYALFMFQKDDILKRAVNNSFLRDGTEKFFAENFLSGGDTLSFEERFMRADRRSWLVDESLTMTDKMTMASGVEERVPLLDLEVVALADSLPLHYKISPFNTKIILKESFRGRIPDFLLRQPKRGWFSPAAKWLRYPAFYAFAEATLTAEYYAGTRALFNWTELEEILHRHKDKTEYNLHIIWAVMVFQIWAKQYKIHL